MFFITAFAMRWYLFLPVSLFLWAFPSPLRGALWVNFVSHHIISTIYSYSSNRSYILMLWTLHGLNPSNRCPIASVKWPKQQCWKRGSVGLIFNGTRTSLWGCLCHFPWQSEPASMKQQLHDQKGVCFQVFFCVTIWDAEIQCELPRKIYRFLAKVEVLPQSPWKHFKS